MPYSAFSVGLLSVKYRYSSTWVHLAIISLLVGNEQSNFSTQNEDPLQHKSYMYKAPKETNESSKPSKEFKAHN